MVKIHNNIIYKYVGEYPAALHDVIGLAAHESAISTISQWPAYAPTPLHRLPCLAEAMGLGTLWYKDASHRFGLKSFKALDGAYAVYRLLAGKPVTIRGDLNTIMAGLCALMLVREDLTARKQLGIDAQSRVLLSGTEGDTDPDLYQRIIATGMDFSI